MTSPSSTVLAVGASGKFAGLVIPELVKRGAKVRGVIHDSTKERQVRQLGAAEVVLGDMSDRASMNAALKDVDSVFYIAPAFLPNEAGLGISFVEAAAQAGVRRIVFSSVIHPVLSALQNHMQKGPVEEAILTSGMEYTFLHPTVFFQNFTQSWPRIVETGVLAEPCCWRTGVGVNPIAEWPEWSKVGISNAIFRNLGLRGLDNLSGRIFPLATGPPGIQAAYSQIGLPPKPATSSMRCR